MRKPTRRHTVVTAGDGKDYQAVEATKQDGMHNLCRGCVGNDCMETCNSLAGLCGSPTGQGWIFIDNTPEAFAEYIIQRMEQP